MSIGEIQNRIASIQTQIATFATLGGAASQRTTATSGTAAGTAGTATTTTGTASASAFAAALNNAVSAQGATGTPATGTPASAGADGWVAPVHGRVTSHFGPRWGTEHKGMDIAAGTGTPVHAAAAGTVRKASWYGGYGNAVIIDHADGTSTLYGHNSALAVKAGQRVNAGDVISKAGSTGDSTGPHVHFEVHLNGKAIDPEPWLRKHNVKI